MKLDLSLSNLEYKDKTSVSSGKNSILNSLKLDIKSHSQNQPAKKDIVNLSSISKSNNYLIAPANIFEHHETKIIKPKEHLVNPKGNKIADGVWFSDTMKSTNGGIIHVLTVDPSKADLAVEFSDKGKAILPSTFKSRPNFIGAINGQFFADKGAIGDMKSGNKIYQDQKIDSGYNASSNKRFYFAMTKDNQIKTGKGDIGNPDDYKMFFGGMNCLYGKDQIANLEKDIKSGEFNKRTDFSGASQGSSISRSFMGVTADGKVLMVAAGEGSKRSKGVNFVQAANLLKSLGAVEAYVLDGGGSTSMITKDHKDAKTDGRVVKSYISVNSKS